MMLAKGKEQEGMLLAKVKEQDGMMLAKVKEQDWMMLANVKVPSIPTSAACWDDVQLTNTESSYYTFYNRQLLNRTASSKPQIYLKLFTTVNYFNGLSITSSDCVLLQAADVGILGTFTFASIIQSCSFTFASIIPSCSFTFASSIPSCSFPFASIIPSYSFTFASVIPTLFSFFY